MKKLVMIATHPPQREWYYELCHSGICDDCIAAATGFNGGNLTE